MEKLQRTDKDYNILNYLYVIIQKANKMCQKSSMYLKNISMYK